MSRLKQFIHDIHRRSLWQVLGIYVVGGWVALQVAETLTESAALPEWFPSLALGLLIIGLPVVLATAFVQSHDGGGPSGEVETTSGGTPIPAAEPTGGVAADSGAGRFLTWRNAIIGGVVAFALWGAFAAVWLMLGNRAPDVGASTTGTDGQIRSIAVLAFEDMSPEGDQEYFSDGMAEEILDALAKVEGLRVAARSSAFKFKGTSPDVREVGETLGVEAVLEGSVRKSGDRLRITAQLVNAEDGFHIWSDSYDRGMEDIFAVQEDIAAQIVDAMGFETATSVEPAGPASERTIAAHDYYLLGRQRFNARASKDDIEAAFAYYEQAAREDSLYARAHAAMALLYAVWPQWDPDYPREKAIRLGKAEAARSAELDPTAVEPDAALCQIAAWYEWEWSTALEHCERALARSPNYVTAQLWLAEVLVLTGRPDEARAAASRALELDPLAPTPSNIIALTYNQKAEYDEAIAQSRFTLELNPETIHAIFHDVIARFMSGREEGLERAFLKWAPTAEDSIRHSEFIALYLEADADEAKRLRAIEMIPELSIQNDWEPTLYLLLGEPDLAMDDLERLYEERSHYLPELMTRQFFEPLHDDPRFIEIKRNMGLDRPPAAG